MPMFTLTYRYHYYLQKDCWSIHVKSCCYQGHYVIIQGPWETEVKPNRKSNPRGWVTARSHQITYFCMEDALQPVNRKILEDALLHAGGRLRYDKMNMSFNLSNGQNGLLFSPEGAFVLHQQKSDNSEFLFSFAEGEDTANVG
ncbi:hypothetical protein BK120_33925 [Paenibacillus sp. FSL A5-0031]|nr:hypothetical protein BK120_33925 [Paenibacillus sp. FSL A5-0031]